MAKLKDIINLKEFGAGAAGGAGGGAGAASGFPGGIGTGLSLPSGYINGAPKSKDVKKLRKKLLKKYDKYGYPGTEKKITEGILSSVLIGLAKFIVAGVIGISIKSILRAIGNKIKSGVGDVKFKMSSVSKFLDELRDNKSFIEDFSKIIKDETNGKVVNKSTFDKNTAKKISDKLFKTPSAKFLLVKYKIGPEDLEVIKDSFSDFTASATFEKYAKNKLGLKEGDILDISKETEKDSDDLNRYDGETWTPPVYSTGNFYEGLDKVLDISDETENKDQEKYDEPNYESPVYYTGQ